MIKPIKSGVISCSILSGGSGSEFMVDEKAKEAFLRNLIIGCWMLVTCFRLLQAKTGNKDPATADRMRRICCLALYEGRILLAVLSS